MTNTEWLLIQLIQECAEVQKAATKALLHGLRAHDEESGIIYNNAKDIAVELCQVVAVAEMLEKREDIPAYRNSVEFLNNKQRRVKKYMEQARKKGTLV